MIIIESIVVLVSSAFWLFYYTFLGWCIFQAAAYIIGKLTGVSK